MDIWKELRDEGVDSGLLDEVRRFREAHPLTPEAQERVPVPKYLYYGREVWESAAAALLLTAAVIYVPFLTAAFGFTSISLAEYAVAMGLAAITRAAITAEAEPEITPQISPMTSLQNDDTRFALRMSRSASRASGTLRDAMA